MDRRYQELLEQVRLLDTEAFQLKKEGLVSQLQEAYAAKDSKRIEQEGKLLEAVQEMQDRTGVTSVGLSQVLLSKLERYALDTRIAHQGGRSSFETLSGPSL